MKIFSPDAVKKFVHTAKKSFVKRQRPHKNVKCYDIRDVNKTMFISGFMVLEKFHVKCSITPKFQCLQYYVDPIKLNLC